MKKPLEFVIYKSDGSNFKIKFWVEDEEGNVHNEELTIENSPKCIELDKHYEITDTYGYSVIDDRKGL